MAASLFYTGNHGKITLRRRALERLAMRGLRQLPIHAAATVSGTLSFFEMTNGAIASAKGLPLGYKRGPPFVASSPQFSFSSPPSTSSTSTTTTSTAGLRLQQPRLLDFDYNNLDCWTSTSTTSTTKYTGLRLQQPRLLDFDYNNLDYWPSTTTTSTPRCCETQGKTVRETLGGW
ncbi:hypothetical protein BC832DRAFT_616685 [Gaertneriomyces semiglobifer]|nr:hypothetical protein BC832DRAFT_616685 [Gaertneriomyces semiglobifer]